MERSGAPKVATFAESNEVAVLSCVFDILFPLGGNKIASKVESGRTLI